MPERPRPDRLQDLLDRSLDRASAFTRSLEGGHRTASEVEEFVNATRNITVAVVRLDGSPHAAPVIGGCLDGSIYVTISPGSVLAACLERSRRVAFTVADLLHNLIGVGTSEDLGRVHSLEGLCADLDRASPYGKFAPEDWDGHIHLLHPDRLFAF